jgi:hypothetical protein
MTANPKPLPGEVRPPTDPISGPASVPPIDPFADLSKLRMSQSFIQTAGVKKLLTKVPIGKPNSQDFFRVHPSPDFRDVFAFIKLKDEGETYLLMPRIAQEMPPNEFFMATIFLATNRQGVARVWPVHLPAPDGTLNEWHRSEADAAEYAMRHWIRIQANRSLRGYEQFEATGSIPDPAWPELSFPELLKIAFKDFLVDSFDHPLIKRLRGA